MADYGGGGGACCRCCFSFIVTSGFTALFIWLSLRASKPVCSIQYFYVPALNKTENSTADQKIYFDLKLDNQNRDKGIYYDPLNLTFYYGSDRSFPVGNMTLDGFYQGHQKKAGRQESVDTSGVPWADAVTEVSNGTAVFRVDLATAVRFKILAWKTKKYGLVVHADVEVNGSGQKIAKKGIRLNSAAPELGRYRARMGLLVIAFAVLNLLFIV